MNRRLLHRFDACVVKTYIEAFKPRVDIAKAEGANPILGFMVQSGFPEALHSRLLQRNLEKLVRRLCASYAGTVVRGGGEALQSRVGSEPPISFIWYHVTENEKIGIEKELAESTCPCDFGKLSCESSGDNGSICPILLPGQCGIESPRRHILKLQPHRRQPVRTGCTSLRRCLARGGQVGALNGPDRLNGSLPDICYESALTTPSEPPDSTPANRGAMGTGSSAGQAHALLSRVRVLKS